MASYQVCMAKLLNHAGFKTEPVGENAVLVSVPIHRRFAGQLVFDHYDRITISSLDQLMRFLDHWNG